MGLFDNIPPATTLSDEMPEKGEEKKTPPASPAKEKTTPEPGSEAAKTPPKKGEEKPPKKKDESDDTRFDKHSRFKEVIKQRDEFKQKFEKTQKELDEIRQEIATLKGVSKGEIPAFETTEDLQKYLADLPGRIKKELLDEMKSTETKKTEGATAADELVTEQLEVIKDTLEDGEEFDEKALLEHALKYGMTDLAKAWENLQEMRQEKKDSEEEDKEKEIEKRKKDSKLHSKPGPEKKSSGLTYKRGQDLDDIIDEAKANIPK